MSMKPDERPTPLSFGSLLWMILSFCMWWFAVQGSVMTVLEVIDLVTGGSHAGAGVTLTLPARVARIGLFLLFAGPGGVFVWLRLTGRVPPALPRPAPGRPGPSGLRRIPWCFYSLNAPLGRFRGLAVISLRVVGVLVLILSPVMWAEDRRFDEDGARTGSGVVVARREVPRGESVERVLDITYADRLGDIHRDTLPENRWPRGWRWDAVAVGARLPEIEYLREHPQQFRFTSKVLAWWQYPLSGLALLVAAAVLVWSADWFPLEAIAGGSE